MKTIFPLLLLLFTVFGTRAQVQPFGIVDTADLRLKSCDFEKDANAEILFNHCVASYDGRSLEMEHHKRLKVFNMKNAADLGDVSITVPNDREIKVIKDLEAETFNLENGKIEVIKLDKKSFFKQKIDKWHSRITFTFPAMKDGSVLEYHYKEVYDYAMGIPDWYFQSALPVRYSQYEINAPKRFSFFRKLFITQELTENTETKVAMAKVPSLSKEPYMDTYFGNLQHASFEFTAHNVAGKVINDQNTWQNLGSNYIFDKAREGDLKLTLKDEDKLIAEVKNLTPEQKMAHIFRKVRDTMTCDDDTYYDYDNLAKAWNRRKCSTEKINLILYKLLTDAGLDCGLLQVSTDPDDRVIPGNPTINNLDETVVHVQIDKDRYYVLDASEKENKCDEIPFNLLNTYGLYMNLKQPSAGLLFIQDQSKARNIVYVNAEIKADGKMAGRTQISNTGYNRIKTIKAYKADGEKKFIDELRDNDNNLKISSYKIDNMEIDTLPLVQNIDFTLEMPGADENYIYLNPKLFSGFDADPFISNKRVSNIDFSFRNNYYLNGYYTIPAGYKIDALPKNVSMMMPDSSIKFKQVTATEGNVVTIHCLIDYNRSYFGKNEYPALFDFYKKMYEMLSQPIVLKKG